MALYHGTSQLAAKRIIERGLMPVSMTGEEPTRHRATNEEVVYLTDIHAPYYAYRRCLFDECARAAIIEIIDDQLDSKAFCFDEIVLEQVGRGDDKLPEHWNTEFRLRHYRELINHGSVDNVPWTTSLAIMGSAAYRGSIPVSAIRRIVIVDLHVVVPQVFGSVDPEISIFNHKIRKKPNLEMTRNLFDLKLEIEGVDRHEYESQ